MKKPPAEAGGNEANMLRILFAAAIASLLAGSAEAATIQTFRSGDRAAIVVQGTIEDGDEEVFRARVSEYPTADRWVSFSSYGGNLYAGLVIGEIIRKHGFMTVVKPRATCASVCALAWLAGVKRYLYPSSRVGFHAAIHRDTKKATASGNALIGAYLMRLGYSYQTVWWLLERDEDMQWLTANNAAENGIEHVVLEEEAPRPTRPTADLPPTLARRSVLDQLFGPQRRVGDAR